ncbi:MAG: hypothetical protein AB1921_19085, partial [Thermodesulfobacteriota bacterium]
RAWDKERAGMRQGRVSLADVARIRREGGSWWDETASDEEKARWQNDREAFLTDHVNSALAQFENLAAGGKGNGGGQNLTAGEQKALNDAQAPLYKGLSPAEARKLDKELKPVIGRLLQEEGVDAAVHELEKRVREKKYSVPEGGSILVAPHDGMGIDGPDAERPRSWLDSLLGR